MCLFLYPLLVLSLVHLPWGYSHNWSWHSSPDPVKLKKCLSEMKLILGASPVPLASVDGTGQPTVRDSMLTFNMKGEDDTIGEPFVFPGHVGYNSCKTNGLAYDPVVTACLLVVMDHFSKAEVTVGSDGKIDEDWAEGIALYKKVLSRESKTTKGNTVGDLINNINLKPTWDWSRLWIVFGLLGVGGAVAWYIFNPKPDFTIHIERQGSSYVKGDFPESYAQAVRSFFLSDMPIKRNVTVTGWHESDGRFRLNFAGPLSDREQQQIRTFFGMLRRKAPTST